MYEPRGPVHVLLQCAIEVWVSLGRGSETHLLAEVVATVAALGARTAEVTSFNGDTVTDVERERGGDVWSEGDDFTCRFVSEAHGMLERKVAVTAVEVVVEVGTAETGSTNSDLDLIVSRSSVLSLLDAKVLGAVKNGRCVRAKRRGSRGGGSSGAVHGVSAVLLGDDNRCRRECDGDRSHDCKCCMCNRRERVGGRCPRWRRNDKDEDEDELEEESRVGE